MLENVAHEINLHSDKTGHLQFRELLFYQSQIYRTRAINNRGLYSGKTFWALVCGYYSREVTIQEKLFALQCLELYLQCLQPYFTEIFIISNVG